MAIAVMVISVYALVVTPEVDNIPIYSDGRLYATESKVAFLFRGPFAQILVFAFAIYAIIFWKRHARECENLPIPYYSGVVGVSDFKTLMKEIAVFICVMGAVALGFSLTRVAEVLSVASR